MTKPSTATMTMTRSPTTKSAVESECNCGVVQKSMVRISGGVEAASNEFPWIVRLFGGCSGHCGGTIVTPLVVLSALHCVKIIGSNKICDFRDEKGESSMDNTS